jgi:glycerophosphoryl diester phosphodiesterase
MRGRIVIPVGLASAMVMALSNRCGAEGNGGSRPAPPRELINADRILIIGHRGASAYAPENTLASFRLAAKQGAELVEDDYYASKDGQLIVIHDSTLDRTTDAVKRWGGKRILVRSKTLEELRQLDAGSWKAPKFAGEKLPTFNEAVQTMLEGGSVPLLERKGGTPEQTLADLKKIDAVEKVIVQSFDWLFLMGLHKLEPKIVLGALGEGKLTDQKIAAAGKTGAAVIGWEYKDIDQDAVDRAHKAGLRIWAWTVDDEKDIRRLKALGIDGIITNRPDSTRKVVESK